MLNFALVKTNLNELNNGHCGNANNCRYTGASVCWAIQDHTGLTYIALNRKYVAEAVLDYANNHWSGRTDGKGDIGQGFINDFKYLNLDWSILENFKEV